MILHCCKKKKSTENNTVLGVGLCMCKCMKEGSGRLTQSEVDIPSGEKDKGVVTRVLKVSLIDKNNNHYKHTTSGREHIPPSRR